MKNLLSIITIVMLSNYIFAQQFSTSKHNRIWYFSESNAGLFFNESTNSVDVTYEHTPLAYEGSCVAADPLTGQLIFYATYNRVFDKLHQQMPNGNNLNSSNNNTSTTSLPCKMPSFENKYYLFSNTAASPNFGTISYSIIDMDLPGNGSVQNPLGDVDLGHKNIVLTSNTNEGFCIVAGSSNNYWLIVPTDSSKIKVFKIDSAGINLFQTLTTGFSIADARSVRYSLAAGKVAVMNMYEYRESIIFDFDYTSGLITNIQPIAGTPMGTQTNYWYGFYDCEWSPDGSKLYMSKYRNESPASGGRLYQYDLNNPSNSPVLIYTISSNFSNMSSGLKLGPDNKIYYLYNNPTYSDHRIVGVINNPNIQGTNCSFNPTKFILSSGMLHTHKFPEFLPVNDVMYALVATSSVSNVSCNGICDGSASVTVTGGLSPYVCLWNTGHVTPDISNLCAGTYTVTIYDNAQNSIVQNITITEPSVLTINIADIQATGCNGENNGSATVIATGGVSPYTFIWDGIPGVNSQTVNGLSAGSYNVMVVDSNGCNSSIIAEIPSANFGTITGIVQFSQGFIGAGDGIVHLYKANVPGFYEVDSSAIYTNGTFILNHIPAGEYFLYVKMNNHSSNPAYNTIFNTYYDSTFKWIDATILTIACEDSMHLIVNMYEKGNGSNGNGNIAGNIHYNSNNKSINGEPVNGATITLELASDNSPIASSNSDSNGFYQFSDIPEGIYSIYIDIPGVPHVSTYSVNITSTDTVFSNLNFVVDTMSSNPGIYRDSTVYVNSIAENVSISVYPNPFIDNINVQYKVTRKGNIEIELIDIEGRIIDSYSNSMDSGSYNCELKGLSNLNSGIYILKTDVDNNIYIKKLIKN